MPKKGEEDFVTLSMVHELLEQQKTFYKELLDQQEKSYKSCLQVIVDSMFACMDNLVKDTLNMSKDIQDLKASLQFSQADLDDLQATKACSTEKIQVISDSLADYQTSINNLFEKMDYVENQTRRNNLLIDGVSDSKSESWSEIEINVKKVISDHLKIDSKLIEIERSHRTGKYDHAGRPRPIVVKLLRYKNKEEILKRAKSLKGTNIFINEDFSENVRMKRKNLLPQLREERKKGNIAFLKYDQLVVHPPRSS